MAQFIYAGSPARIVFGAGVVATLADEIDRLGCRRMFLLSTIDQQAGADRLRATLGTRVAGAFGGAVMHTPVDVTEAAVAAFRQVGADGIVAFGGGTTTGLGKAIAYRTGAPQIAIPTTYAGSEVTPILGQTENGVKTTLKDPKVLPQTVLYDPDLTLGLPVGMSVTSGLNALAHAVEALYAADRNPVSTLMAIAGARALRRSLPKLVVDPNDRDARSDALQGAWLCGTVLGTVGMSLHHKLCHVLGGTLNLPHAETHAVLLPYAVAYNQAAAADELEPLRALFGDDPAGGIRTFALDLGAPPSLAAIGMKRDDADTAAALVVRNTYPNPRPVEQSAVRDLLDRAWRGASPAEAAPDRL